MIEWLKRLWLEEYEVTIWFNKEKLNPFADEKARSKKVFHMKKIQTKKQTHFRGIDIDNNHSWTDRQVVTKVYSGDNGQLQVKQDIYNTTIYDAAGNKQTVTTSHSIDYLV